MWSPDAQNSFTSKKQNTCHQLLQLDGMFTFAVKRVFQEKSTDQQILKIPPCLQFVNDSLTLQKSWCFCPVTELKK